jgi:hypothetical protein
LRVKNQTAPSDEGRGMDFFLLKKDGKEEKKAYF